MPLTPLERTLRQVGCTIHADIVQSAGGAKPEEVAAAVGISASRMQDLIAGRGATFRLDELHRLLAVYGAGFKIEIVTAWPGATEAPTVAQPDAL